MKSKYFVIFALSGASLIASCAAPRPALRAASSGDERADAPRWVPGPDAVDALHELWAAKPFALSPKRLALASGGTTPRRFESEALLYEETDREDVTGRRINTTRLVYRFVKEGNDRTVTFPWAPHRQQRPTIRARVVSPEGAESWLQPSSLVEGSVGPEQLQLTDAKTVSAPLPNVRLGSVVELEVTYVVLRPELEGAGHLRTEALWQASPLRYRRYLVEAPASAGLKVEAIGVPTPALERHGDTVSFALEVGELPYRPYALTRAEQVEQLPRLYWSTGRAWADVAKRYRALLQPALNDTVDFSSLTATAQNAQTQTEKMQAVLRWVSEHTRYTAVQLGAGAVVPTLPSQVLERGYGDCKDLAVLTALALRQLGLSAEVAAINTDQLVPRDAMVGLEAFDHMIVAVRGKDGVTWLDPTAPKYPAGVLPFVDRSQRALIIADDTKTLTATPTHAETSFILKQRYDYELASFGPGKVTVSLELAGAAEGAMRSRLDKCDDAAAHELLANTMNEAFGQAPYVAHISNCAVGSGPLTISATLEGVDEIETLDLSATLALPSRLPDLVVSEGLRGDAPGSDTRTDAQKADQRARFEAEYGISEDEFARGAASLDSAAHLERVYRIKAPAHLVPQAPLQGRTIALGPAQFAEAFRQVEPNTYEVKYIFDAPPDFNVEQVTRFREAYWQRWSEKMPALTLQFEPYKLVEQRQVDQAATLMKKWLHEKPKDATTRARVAALLTQLRLVEQGRLEAERALKDAPDSLLTQVVRANVARNNDHGWAYAPPFERAKAIELFRKVATRLPHHNWVVRTLAELLRRNAQGEVEHAWSKDTQEAAARLEALVASGRAGAETSKLLVEIYLESQQPQALLRLWEKHPELKKEEGTQTVAVLTQGVEGGLKELSRISEGGDRLKGVILMFGALAAVKRYQEANELLERFTPPVGMETQVRQLRAFTKGLAAAPNQVNVKTPEAAARTVIAILSNASSLTDAAAKLQPLLAAEAKNELVASADAFRFVPLPDRTVSLQYDQLYHRSVCKTDGTASLVRVTCALPDVERINFTSYWVREGGSYQLASLGSPRHVAARAFALAQAGRDAEAAQWVTWLLDVLKTRSNPALAVSLLDDVWSRGENHSGSGLQLAAALGWFAYPTMTDIAPEAAVKALATGRLRLSGSLRRKADEMLTSVYVERGDIALAVRTLSPLAVSENEPRLWRALASLESRAGQASKAMSRVTAALRADPKNAEWRATKGSIELRTGKYDRALTTLKKLAEDKGAAFDTRNNLVWAHLMAEQLSDDVERDAIALGEGSGATTAQVHTAAMVLLERGRVLEAANLMGARLPARLDELDEAGWLFRARLLESLGYDEPAKAAYAHVIKDAEMVDLKKRAVARLGR